MDFPYIVDNNEMAGKGSKPTDIARLYNLDVSNTCKIIKRKRWAKV